MSLRVDMLPEQNLSAKKTGISTGEKIEMGKSLFARFQSHGWKERTFFSHISIRL